MQEKQGRMLTWMAGLLVVLVGVVVLGEGDNESGEDDDETWIDALPGVERSQITELTISSGGERLTLSLTVKNLFDKQYLDHASNGDFEAIPGYEGVIGAYEPGREIRLGMAMRF